ncbi:hypothetical protein I6E17_03715 [Fusobacterium perfoetens]|uniref:hypothetical protein n=1 Tax=Fusobacterium perfoetens TaxID=852 RepID=UPI001F192A0F|nr:hypothetical protein [Fusobacterium perfoetens]MCF2625288.1 hypothetical protein [Fusobacterium perfoetens]
MNFKEEREKFLKTINIKLVDFDYKKIEIYKPAIDDGFILSAFISGIEYVNLKKEDGCYCFKLEDTLMGDVVGNFKFWDWKEFKERIKIVFEGDEDDL